MARDWSKTVYNADADKYTASITLQKNVKPVYTWFNGFTKAQLPGEPVSPAWVPPARLTVASRETEAEVGNPCERVEGAAELDQQHVQVEQRLVGGVVVLWHLELLVQPVPRPQRPLHPFDDRAAKDTEGVTTDRLPGGPAGAHAPPRLGDELPGGRPVEHAAVEPQVAAETRIPGC